MLKDILCHRHHTLPAQESDIHFPSFYHSYHMDSRPVLASGPGGEANLGDSGMVSSLVERDTICLWTRLCDVMPGYHHVMVTGQVNRLRMTERPGL